MKLIKSNSRSFNLTYDTRTSVRDIDAIRYNIPANVFNVSAYPQFIDPNMKNIGQGLMSIPCMPGKSKTSTN